jgi:isopenicillin N synthase-like dioxygenase
MVWLAPPFGYQEFDEFEFWQDILKSTLHRVVAPPSKPEDDGVVRERYSIPYVCALIFLSPFR